MSSYRKRKIQREKSQPKRKPSSIQKIKSTKRNASAKRTVTRVIISQPHPVFVSKGREEEEERKRIILQMNSVNQKLDQLVNAPVEPTTAHLELPEMVSPHEVRLLEEKLIYLQTNFNTQLKELHASNLTYKEETRQRQLQIDKMKTHIAKLEGDIQTWETKKQNEKVDQRERDFRIDLLAQQMKEVKNLTDAIREKQSEIEVFEKGLEKRHAEEIERKGERIARLEERLTKMVQNSSGEHSKLQENYVRTREEYDALKKELHAKVDSGVNIQVKERKKEMQDMKEELNRMVQNVQSDIERSYTTVLEELKSAKVKFEERDRKMAELKTTLEEELKSTKVKFEERDRKMAELKTTLEEKLKSTKAKFKEKEVELKTTLEEGMTELKTTLERELKTKDATQTEMSALWEQKAETLDSRLQKETLERNETIKAMKLDMEKITNQIAEKREEVEKLEKSLSKAACDAKNERAVQEQRIKTHCEEASNQLQIQVKALQKRYQQLHTVVISNMEESERENKAIHELMAVHKSMEQEYKELLTSYETQHEEYKANLQKKDNHLKVLESQVKEKLEGVEEKINSINNPTSSASVRQQRRNSVLQPHHARIDELALPKHIQSKKVGKLGKVKK